MKGIAFLVGLLLSSVSLHSAAPIEGPTNVSLGAEAVLDLPEGWRWVPKEQMPAYFAATSRTVSAWDLGVVLVPSSNSGQAQELRLQFEPLGALNEVGLQDPETLLGSAREVAAAVGLRRQRVGLAVRELNTWRWEPNYQAESHVLRFGGSWMELEQEGISMHLRWLGRFGAIKLDWKGDEEGAYVFTALSEQLDEALHFAPGHGLAERQPGDAAAKLDLNALVLDGLFGRGALKGGKQEEPPPIYAWILGALVAAVAAAWLVITGWRSLESWLKMRAAAKDGEIRLGYYEKKLGSRSHEVELEEEEKQEGY